MYLEVLDPTRKWLLSELRFTRERGFYLAGGTALALHLGHRTSVDFDFYRGKKFKEGAFRGVFEEHFAKKKLKIIRDYDNTFEVDIDNIHLSCFYYRYKLIRPLNKVEGVSVASLEDITAMKMVAIVQRGTYRDFIDIYYLIQSLGLEQILALTSEKYKTFDVYSGLRGLLYFEDAEKDTQKKRIKIFDKSLTWKKVKKYITAEVIKYQKSFFKL